tara:strand:+ start:223 stop:1272 length:1050 start_codon:yes stop_codon:yes gene_type:complete
MIRRDVPMASLMQRCLSFDDVLLVPQKSDIESRSEIRIAAKIKDVVLETPIISSPMDTVTEGAMVKAMAEHGGLGIVHRYNSIEDQTKIVQSVKRSTKHPAAAIGVSGDFIERAHALVNAGAKILCIDVAHGHHVLTERAIKSIKDSSWSGGTLIMAGNVATAEAFEDLQSWGADAIRVGVGGGSICSTRIQTGHGVSTFQSIIACSFVKRSSALVADGGIKTAGDIVKCIAAGADFVMLGSLLAGTDESPGEIFEGKTGKKYKAYRGMASREAQVAWRGEARSLEGISTTIPYKGSVEEIMNKLVLNVKSGFSYSGARNQNELRERCTFIQQSDSSRVESSTHILLNK